jgi:hypothetical protein
MPETHPILFVSARKTIFGIHHEKELPSAGFVLRVGSGLLFQVGRRAFKDGSSYSE